MAVRAAELAESAHLWAHGRSKLDGTGFYLVPGSTPGVAHYANSFGCTCPSYRHRGVCAHNEACKLLQRREDAAIEATVQTARAERLAKLRALVSND